MDSGFRYRPGFRIPMLDIPDSKEKNSRIPDSGLPYMGREILENYPNKYQAIKFAHPKIYLLLKN